jgi:Mn-dependent DtxR family transcriptional regulator
MMSVRAVQQTSVDAYLGVMPSLGDRQSAIYRLLMCEGPLSNKQIARLLEIPINSVTPRVHELRGLGLVIRSGYRTCPSTHCAEIVWEVVR